MLQALQRRGLHQRLLLVLQVALQRAHLPTRLALFGVALPGALARPLVGLLTGAAPSAGLPEVQAALAAVPAQLGFVQRRARNHGGRLVHRAPALGAGGVVGQQSALVAGSRRQLSSVASLMPSSAANSASARLCGGSLSRSTASLRSSEYLGTALSSSPPVAVTVLEGGGDN